jgi:hypothetical protein
LRITMSPAAGLYLSNPKFLFLQRAV